MTSHVCTSSRTAILAAAVLGVAGLGFSPSSSWVVAAENPGSAVPNATNDTARAGAKSDATNTPTAHALPRDDNGVPTDSRELSEVQGVRKLFAQATNAAVNGKGVGPLAMLFANENSAGPNAHAHQGGAQPAGSAQSSTGARSSSGAQAQSSAGTAGAVSNSGTVRSTGAASAGSPTGRVANPSAAGQASAGQANAGSSPSNGSAYAGQSRKLESTLASFAKTWQQKYHTDFHVKDAALVLNDINASDIMNGKPRLASGEIRAQGGSGSDSAGANDNIHTGNNGTAAARGEAGPGIAGKAGEIATPARGSANSNANDGNASPRNSSGLQSTGGATPAAGTVPQNGVQSARPSASGIPAASRTRSADEVEVRIPPIRNAPGTTLDLLKDGSGGYRFVVNGIVDRQRLASELNGQLQALLANQKDWPADAEAAERLVTQHVLLAVSHYATHGTAGAHNGAGRVSGT